MPGQALTEVVVIKLDPQRQETWRYSGRVLKVTGSEILLEAFFNRPDRPFHGIVMREGDRFVEKYFTDRWYNIYEIHDRGDDRIKAWYCNICRPAEINGEIISYVDLALDLLVYPDGRQLVLDEDEFKGLNLSADVRSNALSALEELKAQFSSADIYKFD